VTGGLQDRVKMSTKQLNPKDPKAKPTMHESMFWTNVSGCLLALALALFTGHLMQVGVNRESEKEREVLVGWAGGAGRAGWGFACSSGTLTSSLPSLFFLL
jgi:hypothetical protein